MLSLAEFQLKLYGFLSISMVVETGNARPVKQNSIWNWKECCQFTPFSLSLALSITISISRPECQTMLYFSNIKVGLALILNAFDLPKCIAPFRFAFPSTAKKISMPTLTAKTKCIGLYHVTHP